MKLVFAVSIALAASVSAQIPTDGVGLAIGGFGGGITLEAVTDTSACLGSAAVPPLPNTPTGSIEGWVAEYVDGKVYLCGGSDINNRAECYSFPIGQGYWDYSGTLDDAREYGSAIVMGGQMVILGGYNDRNGWLDSVEIKDVNAGTWTTKTEWKMPRALFNMCAAALDDTRIMIMGGNEYGEDYRDLVDILDTTTGTWTPAAPLSSGRASHSCIKTEYNGQEGIMVAGGCINDCQDHINTVEFYDIATGEWSTLPGLNQPRMGHGMAFVNGMVAVIGGYEANLINTIELWDGAAWTEHPDVLTNARWAYGMPRYIPMSELGC